MSKEIDEIHKPFIKWLRENDLYYINHRPDTRSGIRSGHMDFTIIHCNRVLLLEAKTEEGKLSKKQIECFAHLRRMGTKPIIVYSASEAIAATLIWLGVEKASTEPPECVCRDSGCPLDNEVAAGLIAKATCLKPETDVSAGGALKTEEAKAEPVPYLFVADFGTKPCVFLSNGPMDNHLVRTATPYDLLTIPRK